MIDTAQNFAVKYVPSMRQRIFRKLGYRYHLGEEPEGTEALAGWMRTDMHMHFSFWDRIRLTDAIALPSSTKNYPSIMAGSAPVFCSPEI